MCRSCGHHLLHGISIRAERHRAGRRDQPLFGGLDKQLKNEVSIASLCLFQQQAQGSCNQFTNFPWLRSFSRFQRCAQRKPALEPRRVGTSPALFCEEYVVLHRRSTADTWTDEGFQYSSTTAYGVLSSDTAVPLQVGLWADPGLEMIMSELLAQSLRHRRMNPGTFEARGKLSSCVC